MHTETSILWRVCDVLVCAPHAAVVLHLHCRFWGVEDQPFSTSSIIMSGHDDGSNKPRDAAEAKAQEFEDKHDHQRGGHDKQGTSGSSKPHSVRNA
jgi:hypothetical protein